MDSTPTTSSAPVRSGGFASTHWSVVLLAGGARDSPEAQDALTRLCLAYWYPLYAFIRRQGYSVNDAEDLTQEFFTRFLEKDFLSAVDQSRGKFRNFLMACCEHFLANQRAFARAQKRGGNRPTLSLDFPGAAARYRAEPASAESPEKLFERRWALIVLDQVLMQLQQEYTANGNGAMFDHLKKVLLGATDARSYGQIGADLGMSDDAARKAAQRLRQRYRSVLRERIADTVDEPARIGDEIRDLFAALNS